MDGLRSMMASLASIKTQGFSALYCVCKIIAVRLIATGTAPLYDMIFQIA
jgi:hypothetical protein